jgi:hypothetical protein
MMKEGEVLAAVGWIVDWGIIVVFIRFIRMLHEVILSMMIIDFINNINSNTTSSNNINNIHVMANPCHHLYSNLHDMDPRVPILLLPVVVVLIIRKC